MCVKIGKVGVNTACTAFCYVSFSLIFFSQARNLLSCASVCHVFIPLESVTASYPSKCYFTMYLSSPLLGQGEILHFPLRAKKDKIHFNKMARKKKKKHL